MYSETNNLKYFMSLIIFYYFVNTNYLFALDIKDVPISISKSVYIKSEDNLNKVPDENSINKEYKLFKNSFIYRVNVDYVLAGLKGQTSKIHSTRPNKVFNNLAGKYIFAYSQDEVNEALEPFLLNLPQDISFDKSIKIPKPKLISKFRVILDENERVYFTDGSLLIKFNTNVNFSEFASVNNLMLKKEYIDLNMGVYVHNNFNTLENKIESLQEISSISNVQYNVIDPYILPE